MAVQPPYGENDPLSIVVTFLEKANYDSLANQVIDVFAQASHSLEQVNLIAKLYLDIRNNKKAEEYALRVLGMAQGNEELYNCRSNLAKMYNNINEPEKSLFYSNINLAVVPDDPDTKLEMVFSYYLLNHKAKAEAILRDMKANEHRLDEHHQNIVNFNLGTYDMEAGKFLQGLAGFLINIKKLELWFSHRELPYKFWNGGAYPGKTLIMFMEGGGIGDEFITIRYMDDLKALGFRPVYYTGRQDVYDIFNRCGYETVMSMEGLPEDSLWTYAMQTPLWLESTPESVMKGKYLWPSDDAREKWEWVKKSTKLKIGLRWQGNAKNERDLHRKVPLKDVMTMLKNTLGDREVELYSLQIGDAEEEVADYPELIDVSNQIHSFNDTMALLENLDFVISSCTSVLHASAIVGTPTLAMIPISAYFTWLSPTPDRTSVWYPNNLRLFRQVTPKKWDEPLQEIQEYITKNLLG